MTPTQKVASQINWRIFRMRGLASQLSSEANTNALLPAHLKLKMRALSKELNNLTRKANPRLVDYRKHSYKEGRML